MPLYRIGDKSPQLAQPCWIAPNAVLVGDVHVGELSSVWWNCVLRADTESIRLGARVNVQDGCVLHADPGSPLTLEDNVSVGHMVMLHGCTVGAGSLVGIKSVILNDTVIGRDCLIGANALISEGKTIPDRSVVMGSPGRIIRTLNDRDVERLRRVAAHYVKNWQRYSESMELIG